MKCLHCGSINTEVRGRHGYYERGRDEVERIYVCNDCSKLFYEFDGDLNHATITKTQT